MIDQGLTGYVCGRRVTLRGYAIEQNSLHGWQITPPYPLARDAELRIYCNGALIASLVGSQQDEAWDFDAYLTRIDRQLRRSVADADDYPREYRRELYGGFIRRDGPFSVLTGLTS